MVVVRGPAKFKASHLWETPDDGKRYEVIDGDLYVTPPPAWGHQLVVGRLFLRLGNFIELHGLGKIVPAPTGVVLDEETAVERDIVFVSREREHLISARGVEGPPELVVEALSPSTEATDRGIRCSVTRPRVSPATGSPAQRPKPSRSIVWASAATSSPAFLARAQHCDRSSSLVSRS